MTPTVAAAVELAVAMLMASAAGGAGRGAALDPEGLSALVRPPVLAPGASMAAGRAPLTSQGHAGAHAFFKFCWCKKANVGWPRPLPKRLWKCQMLLPAFTAYRCDFKGLSMLGCYAYLLKAGSLIIKAGASLQCCMAATAQGSGCRNSREREVSV